MAIRDIGEAGPKQGPPSTVYISPARHLGALFPWIIILPFFLLRENRKRRAFAVLIPTYGSLALAMLLAYGFQAIGGFASLIRFPPAALGTVWLLSGRFSRTNRAMAFLQAFATVVLIGLATGLLAQIGDGPAPFYIFMTILLSLVLILPFAFGAYRCRRKFKAVHFGLWTALACYLIAFLAICLPALTLLASTGGEDLAWIFVPVLIGTLFSSGMLGTIFAGFLTAFIVLTFQNKLYRGRFFSVIRLPDASRPPPPPTAKSDA